MGAALFRLEDKGYLVSFMLVEEIGVSGSTPLASTTYPPKNFIMKTITTNHAT